MKRALLCLALAALTGCAPVRSVALTFGSEGEGLDGFMCKDNANTMLLSRLPPSRKASLVIDFIRLGGVPGCRTGQLMKWCTTHECKAIQSTRSCVDVTLPAPMPEREALRTALLEAMRSAPAHEALDDAPDEFVIVRVVGTVQSCDALLPAGDAALPDFDKSQLVGCAYSCPVLLDKVEQDVYLGFETLTATCEQGVRICSDGQLQWQP
jgi:hypothetical protein